MKRPTLTIALRIAVIQKCGPRCAYCGKEGYAGLHFGKPTVLEFDKKKKYLQPYDNDSHVLLDIPMHFEHVHPVIKGGETNIDNIVIACPKCNWKKGTKNIANGKISS